MIGAQHGARARFPSPTHAGESNKCIHPFQDRALTLREGARLQSFDDDFSFAGTRTQIAKQIGNAVPPLLGQAIAESVLDMLR